jgi:hypothetical protein
MPNRFPNTVQSCVLFEKRGGFFSRSNAFQLEQLAKTYFDIQAAKAGHCYNIVEHVKGKVIQFYGGQQLMIRLEFIDGPANHAAFAGTLSSPFTRMAVPDAEQVIKAHATHVLINVRHGVLPDLPVELAALVESVGIKEGYSLPQFRERLDVCALLTRLAHDIGKASLIHWTQSNMILKPDAFDAFAASGVPSPLHVHPRIYQEGESGGKPSVGVITHGAQHFIGREIQVVTNTIPWVENFEAAMAFMKLALVENGYIIPDGDNFGVEGGDFSYRVKHVADTNTGEAATPGHYELELRYSRKHDYHSPNHQPDGEVINIDTPPPELIDPANPDEKAMMEKWQQRRQMSENVGGQFRVTAPPAASPSGGPRVFGKRTLN